MRKGVRPDGKHLYPAFPYPSFAKASDEDIAAIYAYLKTIAPVKAENKPNEMKFPYNIRALMGIWNALFHKAAAYQPDDNQSTEWNRGAYLVEGLGHCGACHTPRNFLGAEQSDLALAGGVYMDKTANGEYRKWAAVNLTPAKTGLGAWSADDIAEYLKTGINPRATVYGPMNEVVINSTSRLDEADLKAMAVYLKGRPEKAQNPGKAPSEEVMRAGAAAYTVRCGTCHLPTGLGAPMGVEPLGVPLAGSAVVQAPDPASLINTIIYGPQLPPYPFASPRRMMEPWGDKMSDEEIANVASYVRASWGNEAGLVTPEDVAKQR
jgi:mono/diheme cytochrome c family protein